MWRGRRRSWLASVAVGLASALALSACGGGSSETEDPLSLTGKFDWRRYEGEEIRFVAGKTAWQALIDDAKLKRFEDLTGIHVNMEALPEDQFRQRLQVELTSGSSDIDVFMSSVLQDGRRFHSSGWYEDLTPYVTNPTLTAPDYNFEDFSKSVIEGHSFDGELIGLPVMLETQMLFYRKDILDKHGLEVPKTFAELEKTAKAIDNAGDGVYGFSARGARAAAVTQLSSFLYNHGADYVDEEGKAAFNTPEGRRAFELYGRLVREYGPPGAANNSWEELLPLFQQGKLALWADNSGQAAQAIDPKNSRVADSVGFAPMPAGPAGSSQTFFSWALAMSSQSEKKGPAWYFIQWATSPEMVEAVQKEGVAGGRQSVPFGPDVPEDFVETFRSSLQKARPQLPPVRSVPEVRDVIGEAIVTSIQGGNLDAALTKAADEFDRIVAAEGN